MRTHNFDMSAGSDLSLYLFRIVMAIKGMCFLPGHSENLYVVCDES